LEWTARRFTHTFFLSREPYASRKCSACATVGRCDEGIVMFPNIRVSHKLRVTLRCFLRIQDSMMTDTPFRARRVLGTLGIRRTVATQPTPPIFSPDIPIEEELTPGYDSRHFYPVNPGDLLHNRYEMTAKLGFGSCSTVWLARDTQRYLSDPPDTIALTSL